MPIVQPLTTELSANQVGQQQFDRIADRLGLDRGVLVVPDVSRDRRRRDGQLLRAGAKQHGDGQAGSGVGVT